MTGGLLAIIVVRNGILPAGAAETIAEANGHAVIIGTMPERAAADVQGASVLTTFPTADVRLRDLAHSLTALPNVVRAHGLILPASPDGRDLAPLLATALARPLYCASTVVHVDRVVGVRTSGRVGREYVTPRPFVATLIPGVRGLAPTANTAAVETVDMSPSPTPTAWHPDAAVASLARSVVTSVEVLPPDPATMDLSEASSILGGGLGLGSKARFEQLGRIASAVGASVGGTRVASDAGWIPFERQIGTTGVAVKPTVYVAFGISGATQHTSGLGDPDHVISVNLDPTCPMMAMSDVAIVSDAGLVLDALEIRLSSWL